MNIEIVDGEVPVPLGQQLRESAGDVAVEVAVEPREVEIGRAFEVVVQISHPEGTVIEVGESPFGVEAGWIEFQADRPRVETTVEGRSTRLRYEVAAIEQAEIETESGWVWSATRVLDLPALSLVDGETTTSIEVEAPALTVLSVLEVGATEPRPMPGLDGLEPEIPWTPTASWVALAYAAVVVAALCAVLARRWFGRPDTDDGSVTLEAERVGLRRRVNEGDLARDRVFEAVRLARRAVDDALGRSARGLDDDAWLASLPREGDWLALRARLAEFLARATRVRYGNSEPTEWAVEELAREGLELVERVGTLELAMSATAEVRT